MSNMSNQLININYCFGVFPIVRRNQFLKKCINTFPCNIRLRYWRRKYYEGSVFVDTISRMGIKKGKDCDGSRGKLGNFHQNEEEVAG